MADPASAHAYEIKPIAQSERAAIEAYWYSVHMNVDPVWNWYGFWIPGTEYLADKPVGGPGKYIGPWPTDPNYQVRAGMAAPGAIVYWSKRNDRDNRQTVSSSALSYAAWLAALAVAIAALNGGNNQGGLAPVPVPVYSEGFSPAYGSFGISPGYIDQTWWESFFGCNDTNGFGIPYEMPSSYEIPCDGNPYSALVS